MSWPDFIAQQQQQSYFQQLQQYVQLQRQQTDVYPAQSQVFAAFDFCPFEQVKVVILGQDPYHGPKQAQGLAFSVAPEVKIPPSLKNIFKELQADVADFRLPSHGCLVSWAKQGVLLLNSVLTVNAGQAHSHAKAGWQQFTDAAIAELNKKNNSIVFLLWGAAAQKKAELIDQSKHQLLLAAHPSPLSAYRGFFGCQHFSQCNRLLRESGQSEVIWQIDGIGLSEK